MDNLGWAREVVDAPDLEALGTVLHARLTAYAGQGAPTTERVLAVRVAYENQVRSVKSHPTATPFRAQIRPPLQAGECFCSDGAETGVAEPHIAEQSRSWRAASGELEVTRGS